MPLDPSLLDDLVQTPQPSAASAGQVRLGTVSEAQTVWHWNPPGGIGNDHGNQSHLEQNPDHVVACLDFKNAFGTIDRPTCIKALRELCPHQPAWLDAVHVLLSWPALVVNPAENHLARTYDGLPQGTHSAL